MTPTTAIQRAEQWRKEGACGEAAKVAIALLNELERVRPAAVTRYAIRLRSKRAGDHTPAGAWFWVEPAGQDAFDWGGHQHAGEIDKSSGRDLPWLLSTWETPEQAAAFAETWKGYPWWVKPDGRYQIIPVQRVYESSSKGWKHAGAPDVLDVDLTK